MNHNKPLRLLKNLPNKLNSFYYENSKSFLRISNKSKNNDKLK